MKVFNVSSKFTQSINRQKTSFGKTEPNDKKIIASLRESIHRTEVLIKDLESQKQSILVDAQHYEKMLYGSKELGSVSSKVYYEARLDDARTKLEAIYDSLRSEKESLRILKNEYAKLTK